ncbi:MAG: hypothetical protein L0229_16975 [Blastocatellia bacterium]|nr:hypothetical protein [Blastocatellia bacterium]
MSCISIRRKVSVLLIAILIAGLAPLTRAQKSALGRVDFPTSGSEKAQAHFLRGIAALHSFWYEEALDEFRESTRLDPDFAMGYWGEAQAHNHPLWRQQDTEAARKALDKIKNVEKLTAKERAFINAARVLYGEGDKLARDIAFSKAMEKMYNDYPDDLEVASFYALSLLGTVRDGDKGFARQMKAGAIALDVFRKNPDHPGAAHYIIHSFDDPEHAILALPAARRYAEVAPDAHHAQHMPSHIFLQLGMWPEGASSNETAWAVSNAWVKRKNLKIGQRDYHSLSWLLYIYMQQGRYSKADELLAMMRKTVQEASEKGRLQGTYISMATTYLVESRQWSSLNTLLSKLDDKVVKPEKPSEDAAHCAVDFSKAMSYGGQNSRLVFASGLAAAELGAMEEADKIVAKLADLRKGAEKGNVYRAKELEIMELGVAALIQAKKGNTEEAINLMKKATSLEEQLSPPSGPPELMKPSHELFGEILLGAGRHKEAADQFAISLRRQPNRASSLLGAARAAAASGDRAAAQAAYAKFLNVWNQADAKLPEKGEAQDYLGQVSSR